MRQSILSARILFARLLVTILTAHIQDRSRRRG